MKNNEDSMHIPKEKVHFHPKDRLPFEVKMRINPQVMWFEIPKRNPKTQCKSKTRKAYVLRKIHYF